MTPSYTSSFIKIYFWQIISIFARFLSMFIVTPFIVSNHVLYAVYMVCISVMIFMSYADLGFCAAGVKFASECVIKKDHDEEVKILGLVLFVLLIFSFFYAIALFILSIYPTLLIRDATDLDLRQIASTLFLILALFSPTIIMGRFLAIIFNIRLEDYIYQKITIVFTLITIVGVFFFFGHGRYYLVEYFLFSQILTLMSLFVGIFVAYKRYHYNFLLLIKHIKFSKRVYQKTKNLAFSSLYNTFIWFLFFEIDLMVISKFIGINAVAIYAPALTISSFFRLFTGGFIFTPFQTRFNYFIGLSDDKGLKDVFFRTIFLAMPIVILPIICVIMLMKPFIFSWIGTNFAPTILIAQFLALSYILQFFALPSALILVAKEKIKELNLSYTMILLLYWGGIILTYHLLGLLAFSVFKFIVFILSALLYLFFCMKTLEFSYKKIFRMIRSMIIPVLFLIFSLSIISSYLPIIKSRFDILITIGVGGFMTAIAFLLFIILSKAYQKEIKQIYQIGFN